MIYVLIAMIIGSILNAIMLGELEKCKDIPRAGCLRTAIHLLNSTRQ